MDALLVVMRGLVTERDLEEAEAAFPGIEGFYQHLPTKPPTFLNLLWMYLKGGSDACDRGAAHPA